MEVKEIAIGALITALVGAGTSIHTYLEKQRQITEARAQVARELDKLAEAVQNTRNTSEELAAKPASLRDIGKLLHLISTYDHSAALISLEELGKSNDEILLNCEKLEGSMQAIGPARNATNLEELEAALLAIDGLRMNALQLRLRMKAVARQEKELSIQFDSIIAKEQEHMLRALGEFSLLFNSLLNETAAAKRRWPWPDGSSEARVEAALRLARLADMLYTPESLLGKQKKLSVPPTTLKAVTAQIKIIPEDRAYLRKLLRAPSIDILQPTPEFQTQADIKQIVLAFRLNLRKAPTTAAAVLCELKRGEEVVVTAREEKWSYVSGRCGDGWVFSRHLR